MTNSDLLLPPLLIRRPINAQSRILALESLRIIHGNQLAIRPASGLRAHMLQKLEDNVLIRPGLCCVYAHGSADMVNIDRAMQEVVSEPCVT